MTYNDPVEALFGAYCGHATSSVWSLRKSALLRRTASPPGKALHVCTLLPIRYANELHCTVQVIESSAADFCQTSQGLELQILILSEISDCLNPVSCRLGSLASVPALRSTVLLHFAETCQ